MSGKNSFQRLGDDPGGGGRGAPPESVRDNVNGSIKFIEYIGKIVELYLPNFFNVFKEMTNSNGRKNDEGKNDNDSVNPLDPSGLDNDPPGDNKGGAISDDNIFR